jgi:hypothetical protein
VANELQVIFKLLEKINMNQASLFVARGPKIITGNTASFVYIACGGGVVRVAIAFVWWHAWRCPIPGASLVVDLCKAHVGNIAKFSISHDVVWLKEAAVILQKRA